MSAAKADRCCRWRWTRVSRIAGESGRALESEVELCCRYATEFAIFAQNYLRRVQMRGRPDAEMSELGAGKCHPRDTAFVDEGDRMQQVQIVGVRFGSVREHWNNSYSGNTVHVVY